MEEAEELVLSFCGMREETFREQWNILKQSGNYEYELGDYVLGAIAHCTQKDILIFNTRSDGPFDPIFVVDQLSLKCSNIFYCHNILRFNNFCVNVLIY